MARTFATDMNARKMMSSFGRGDEDAQSGYGLRNKYEELIKTTTQSGVNTEKDPVKWVQKQRKEKSQIREVISTFFDRVKNNMPSVPNLD